MELGVVVGGFFLLCITIFILWVYVEGKMNNIEWDKLVTEHDRIIIDTLLFFHKKEAGLHRYQLVEFLIKVDDKILNVTNCPFEEVTSKENDRREVVDGMLKVILWNLHGIEFIRGFERVEIVDATS